MSEPPNRDPAHPTLSDDQQHAAKNNDTINAAGHAKDGKPNRFAARVAGGFDFLEAEEITFSEEAKLLANFHLFVKATLFREIADAILQSGRHRLTE